MVVLGGWSLLGGANPATASWFCIQLTPADTPWVFEKEPFRKIASLELLAALVGLLLLDPVTKTDRLKFASLSLSAGTDNKSNDWLLHRFVTTKFPLCLVLAELTEHMAARDIDFRLSWRRREDNVEADALTNQKFEGFDPSRRIEATWGSLPFAVLPRLLEQSAAYRKEAEAARSSRPEGRPRKRRKNAARPPW